MFALFRMLQQDMYLVYHNGIQPEIGGTVEKRSEVVGKAIPSGWHPPVRAKQCIGTR